MPKPLSMSAADWLLLIFLSMLWGASFFFARIALAELPPLSLALGRVAIAAAILTVLARATGLALPAGLPAWGPYLLLGLLNNALPFALLFWAQTHIASGLAAILTATTPFFTIVVAHLTTQDDKFTPGRAIGLVIGFAGVVLMLGFDLMGDFGAYVLAELACLVAAVLYAISGAIGRRFGRTPPLVISTAMLSAASVILLPPALIVDRPWTLPMPSLAAWSALIGIAVLSTALGYVFYFRILARAGATNLLLVTFLMPVSAILLGTLLLGEEFLPRHLVGMIGIALGLAAIDGRPARWGAQLFARAN
jgi:drug/metabolite transporter (DMT)-like permease